MDRLAPDRGVCALVGDEQVAIFRLGTTDEVLAISNYDPFSRAFVLSRGIVGTKGDVVKVASPVYKQTFDLRTGISIEKPEVRIPTYAVRVVGNMVEVMARRRSMGADASDSRGSIGPLAGFRVAICEFRERERLSEMLASKGATVVSCPLITTTDADDVESVERWLVDLANGNMQACVFFTGEGVRRILSTADRMGIRADVVNALAKMDTVTRGPKPARALRELGILPTYPVEVPTAAGVLDALRARDLGGATVGVQLYPRSSSKRIVDQLKAARVVARPVWPYAYRTVFEERQLRELVTRMASGQIDVIVFTSRAQVDALFEATARLDLRSAALAGLRRTRIAAVGPVVASTLRSRGLRPGIVPSDLFFMKSLVKEIVAASAATSAA
jgi:uroporphyrinogen-III synthase